MPTTRPRHQVTETDRVRQALEVAAERWPGERPGRLILHLIDEGAAAVSRSSEDNRAAHSARVRAIAGKYSGLLPSDHLDKVREGWPE